MVCWVDGAEIRHSSVGWNPFIDGWAPASAGVTMVRWGDDGALG